MRGASALESVLKEIADPEIRTFVVWEPVLPTDWGRPGTAALARVPDLRAVQLWDPKRQLSEAMGGGSSLRKRRDVIWDVVLVYARGARWETAPPQPLFKEGPVVNVIEGFRQKLSSILAKPVAMR